MDQGDKKELFFENPFEMLEAKFVFSRVNATLEAAMSVGRSVGRSVCP